MPETQNDLPTNVREQIVRLCNEQLANVLDLSLRAKQAHWNVRGPHFLQLHQLFDGVYEAAAEASDTIAERAAQLGGQAQGLLSQLQKASTHSGYPEALSAGADHVNAIAQSVAHVAKGVRQASKNAAELGDDSTADLFTEVSRSMDKQLWFVEAHQQKA